MRELTLERTLDPANELEAVLLRHPKLSLTTVSSVISGGKQTTVILFHGDEESIAALKDEYIRDPPAHIEAAEILREGKRELLLYEIEKSGRNPTDISIWVDMILGPETVVRIHKSVEVVRWRILTFREDKIPLFLEKLEKEGRKLENVLMRPVSWYRLASIADARELKEPGIGLSPSEEKVLKAAVRLGFYEIPKGCGVDELAEELAMPRSTAHHTLKRAEAKVIKFGAGWVAG